jgi:hypothetical protein
MDGSFPQWQFLDWACEFLAATAKHSDRPKRQVAHSALARFATTRRRSGHVNSSKQDRGPVVKLWSANPRKNEPSGDEADGTNGRNVSDNCQDTPSKLRAGICDGMSWIPFNFTS